MFKIILNSLGLFLSINPLEQGGENKTWRRSGSLTRSIDFFRKFAKHLNQLMDTTREGRSSDKKYLLRSMLRNKLRNKTEEINFS
jgi:hypothetical protein